MTLINFQADQDTTAAHVVNGSESIINHPAFEDWDHVQGEQGVVKLTATDGSIFCAKLENGEDGVGHTHSVYDGEDDLAAGHGCTDGAPADTMQQACENLAAAIVSWLDTVAS